MYISCEQEAIQLFEFLQANLKKENIHLEAVSSLDGQNFQTYKMLAQKIQENPESNKGILIAKSGITATIACNKFKNIRAAFVHNQFLASVCRQHNNANIMIISYDSTGDYVALELIKEYLKNNLDMSNKNHYLRVEQIKQLEQKYN